MSRFPSEFSKIKDASKADHVQHFVHKGEQHGYIRQERHGGNGKIFAEPKKGGAGGHFIWGTPEDDIHDYERRRNGPGPNSHAPVKQHRKRGGSHAKPAAAPSAAH